MGPKGPANFADESRRRKVSSRKRGPRRLRDGVLEGLRAKVSIGGYCPAGCAGPLCIANCRLLHQISHALLPCKQGAADPSRFAKTATPLRVFISRMLCLSLSLALVFFFISLCLFFALWLSLLLSVFLPLSYIFSSFLSRKKRDPSAARRSSRSDWDPPPPA